MSNREEVTESKFEKRRSGTSTSSFFGELSLIAVENSKFLVVTLISFEPWLVLRCA